MATNNGGPAFARAGCQWTEDHGDGAWSQDGMSLRDYFAAQALNNLVGVHTVEEAAAFAYRLADAMLAERAK